MQTRCFTHSLDTGWSVDEFPDLDDSNTLVLVFGAPEYLDNPQALIDLGGAFPLAVKLGCSTAGEIFGTSITDRTLAVAVIRFERSRIALAVSSIDIESSLNAGRSLGAQLSGDSLKSVFILCDGLQVNGSALVDGLSETLNQSVAITGGLAGDCSRFEQSWTWQGAEPKGGQALAVGLYGDALECRHSLRWIYISVTLVNMPMNYHHQACYSRLPFDISAGTGNRLSALFYLSITIKNQSPLPEICRKVPTRS